jgi:NAD(P)-dependent dehydrogenase (short-subunit alcohol dehydrogenase family)
MSKKLAGKVALVTGGSRGIGAAAAVALAEEGADVAVSYVSSPDKANAVVKQIEKLGVRAAAFKADQADAAQAEGLVKSVRERFGRLDILVNNAGVFIPTALAEANATTDRQYAINVTGVIAAIRAAAKLMNDDGRIITIGSGIASRVGFPGLADYGATKAAIVGYSKGAARDLGARRITVNVVQPGPIDTDMNPDDTELAATMKTTLALGRYGKVDEVAAAIVFLASPGASYITGTTLDVDGGYGA